VIRLSSLALAVTVLFIQDSTRSINLTITQGTALAAAVSPDQRTIAIDLLGSLWLVPISGGTAKKITPDLLEARLPSWSPDSESIAFQGYGDDGTWHIYTIRWDGTDLHAVTSGQFDDREPAWSHDGSRIAFSSDRYGGISTIWQLAVRTGEVRRLTTHDGSMPAWSLNDRQIAFVSSDEGAAKREPGVWTIDASGRERLLLGSLTAVAPAWSPEGTQIAYTTGESTLEVAAQARMLLSSPASVARGENVFPFRPQWLSATEIVYTADGRIRRRSLAGAADTIPFRATVTLQRPTYTIAHRPLETTTPQRVRGILTPVVSPDGHAVAFVALGDIWVAPVDPADGDPFRVTNDAAVELDPAWSPDGTALAFSSDRSGRMELWVHDLRANRDTALTRGGHRISGAAWSPDGNHIAFVEERHRIGVVTIHPDSHAMDLPDFASVAEIGRATWSADNRVIAAGQLLPYSNRYREGLNQLVMHALDPVGVYSSIVFPSHSAGNREDTGPVWSPDGALMAFVTEGRLVTVPVDERGGVTGQIREIANDQPESPSWEGDTRHIVYQTPNGLRRILADGSPPDPIAIDLMWKASPPPERVVVHAGHIFDGVFEGLRSESDIVIERGVIREIVDHRDEVHIGAVVDAQDEIVMPGLIDMNVRFDQDYGGAFGRALLAYGITSVRIPAINPYVALEQQESFEAGRRPGPRVFVAGDPFDGIRAYDRGGVSIASDEQLVRELARARTLDVDFFSTNVRLPDRYERQITEFAHKIGRPVLSQNLYPAVAYGVDGVANLRMRGAYADVIDLVAKSGIALTPTLGIQGAFNARVVGDRSLLFDRRFSLYPLPLVSALTDMATARRLPAVDAALKPLESTLASIYGAGGRILAGSDSPSVPYGFGLHVELEEFVHAGLTPFQALQTATANAAQALGVERELGTIEPGKIADLIFLGGDPILDIRNTRDVKRVMKGGRIFPVADLVNQQPLR
jgi:Tol biopolymer transport system component